jgi:hypothetical protein
MRSRTARPRRMQCAAEKVSDIARNLQPTAFVANNAFSPMTTRYDNLKEELLRRQNADGAPRTLTPEERADWAYGNAVIENSEVTREMAEQAVRKAG